jgi:DNA-binding NarL/FixJ family response regulator
MNELLDRLTPAERRVAVQVARGLSNKEIAQAVGRAEPTIKHQLAGVLRKLGVQSRSQLIVRLLRPTW